ncbi:putative ankyrin repeat-containing domain, PGG domain, ankyrin repeat-containing domain superfamily [Helianthus anomalus]
MPKRDIDEILRGPEQMDSTAKSRFPSRVLFVATRMGNMRFIIEFIRLYPDVIWKQDDKGKTIFHLAIKLRQANIYNLLYEIGAMKGLITPMIDRNGNNMLHMVATSVKHAQFQGAALQMQRELLWFKEVENMIPLHYRSRKNRDGLTPRDLFTKKHKELVAKGEFWMKDTTSQCLVAATLVATITFAANFTLPGGYNTSGIPVFSKELALIIFVISNAVSLISSSTSVLIFLSIYLGHYTEYDFLESLQKKLMIGLAALFLSIVTMLVAFSASFFVLYYKQEEWMPITITILAGMPLILIVTLQLRGLIRDFFHSTYGSRYIFKPKKRVLYY